MDNKTVGSEIVDNEIKENKATDQNFVESKPDRDVEKEYSVAETVAKLRRLADCLEQGKPFEIMIDRERIYVPVRARFNIEHERGDGEEEVEFQFKWDISKD